MRKYLLYVEGIKSKNLPEIITFVDFCMAFDSIRRGKLMEILKAYGVPIKIVDAVNMMHTNTTAPFVPLTEILISLKL